MRYFIGAAILICACLSLSGTSFKKAHVDVQDPEFTEIVCEYGEGFTCVENITFPAMYITAETN